MFSLLPNVAGCDLYAILKNIQAGVFPLIYAEDGYTHSRCHRPGTITYYSEKSGISVPEQNNSMFPSSIYQGHIRARSENIIGCEI